MDHKERDIIIRKKMLGEIADIESFVNGMKEEDFSQSRVAQKAVMMSLINIGELSKSFSDEYLLATQSTPWKEIRGLRNIAAHHYEAIRISNIWITIQNDVPALKQDLLDHPLTEEQTGS